MHFQSHEQWTESPGCRLIGDDRVAAPQWRHQDPPTSAVDPVMPRMSGAEVVERLRKSRSDITAIVVSDHAVPELMQRAAANGAFACLCKPIAADELAQVVAEARGRADLRERRLPQA